MNHGKSKSLEPGAHRKVAMIPCRSINTAQYKENNETWRNFIQCERNLSFDMGAQSLSLNRGTSYSDGKVAEEKPLRKQVWIFYRRVNTGSKLKTEHINFLMTT